MLGALGDALGIRLAGAGLAVGEEHDHTQGLLRRRLCEGFGEGTADVCSTLGLETPNPVVGVGTGVARDRGPARRITAHAAGEGDQSEAITCAQ